MQGRAKELEGGPVPQVRFRTRTEDGRWKEVSSDQLFGGKTVVAFSLPGAFTPTCSSAHVPRYEELAPLFRKHGVDDILCFSVNDAFVMNAWKLDQGAERVTFVPDGNGDFTRAMGLLVDKQDLGFGPRSWRYAMVVKDGVIDKMFIEPDQPGDPYEVSDADTVLRYLTQGRAQPHDILLFTKAGCSHCARAKAMLDARELPYQEVPSRPSTLRAVSGASTTPQVFVDGQHVGGADDLERFLPQLS